MFLEQHSDLPEKAAEALSLPPMMLDRLEQIVQSQMLLSVDAQGQFMKPSIVRGEVTSLLGPQISDSEDS
jgi:hypothetical protein